MTAEDGKCGELLVDQRLGRQGLEVKLDRGFESGVYCGYIEFDALASRVGFAAAHRQATDYCSLLPTQLARRNLMSVCYAHEKPHGVERRGVMVIWSLLLRARVRKATSDSAGPAGDYVKLAQQ